MSAAPNETANGGPNAAAAAGGSEREYPFVRRPVLAIVLSVTVTLLGVIAMLGLPVNRYPQITPPSVQVVAVYPGASAQDVATSVAAPIEQQLAGLDGLLYYKSSNSSDGVMNLSVTFDISRDQDLAAVDVQNAIAVAEPQLPASVRQNGITVTKANADILMVGALTSSNPGDGAAYLTNYGKLYVENEIKRLPGVGNASFFSPLDFSMLLSLDPEKMAQLGITVDDVSAAVRQQNATQPGGRLGREPSPAARSSRSRWPRPGSSRPPSSSATSSCARCPPARSCACATSRPSAWARASTTSPAGSTAARPRSSASTRAPAPTTSRSRPPWSRAWTRWPGRSRPACGGRTPSTPRRSSASRSARSPSRSPRRWRS
jgi:hypothetical protein